MNWIHCFKCGCFKSCPAAQCTRCGNDPLPYGSDPYMFDREYGHYGDTHDHRSSGPGYSGGFGFR